VKGRIIFVGCALASSSRFISDGCPVLPPAIYTGTLTSPSHETRARHPTSDAEASPRTTRLLRRLPLCSHLRSDPDLDRKFAPGHARTFASGALRVTSTHPSQPNAALLSKRALLCLSCTCCCCCRRLPLACALINAGLPNPRLVRDATPPPYPPPRRPPPTSHHAHCTSLPRSAISPC
jgi:hypothetical protein